MWWTAEKMEYSLTSGTVRIIENNGHLKSFIRLVSTYANPHTN